MGVTPIYSIPFAEPTDLVRDWPGLSEDVADAVEAAIAGVPVLAGIGSNVVQTIKTDVFSSTATTFGDITGMTATITPSSATSKVLIIADLAISSSSVGTDNASHSLGFAGGNSGTYVGDAAGSRKRAIHGFANVDSFWSFVMDRAVMVYLDSPGSAAAITYSVQVSSNNAGTFYLNRTDGSDSDGANRTRGASSLTVIEVAA